MSARSSFLRLATLFLVVLSGSCAPFFVTHKPLPPLPDQQAFLHAALHKTLPERIAATAQMKSRSLKGNVNARATIFAQEMSSLRIELYGFLNQLLLLFSTDGTTMALYDPHTSSFYSGAAKDGNLSFFLDEAISPADAVHFLCGIPPIIPYDRFELINNSDSSLYQFELVSHDRWRQHIWVEPVHNRIVKYILSDESGEPVREYRFNDFTFVKNYIIPLTIELAFYKSNTRIVLRYQHIEIPKQIDEHFFSITPPAGATTYPLHELPHSAHRLSR